MIVSSEWGRLKAEGQATSLLIATTDNVAAMRRASSLQIAQSLQSNRLFGTEAEEETKKILPMSLLGSKTGLDIPCCSHLPSTTRNYGSVAQRRHGGAHWRYFLSVIDNRTENKRCVVSQKQFQAISGKGQHGHAAAEQNLRPMARACGNDLSVKKANSKKV